MKIWKNLFGNGDKIKSTEIWHDGYTLDNIIKGIAVPNNSNLNNYVSSGTFYVGSWDNASTILNIPIASAFILEVSTSNFVKQTFTTYNNSSAYVRVYYPYANSWSAWKQIY